MKKGKSSLVQVVSARNKELRMLTVSQAAALALSILLIGGSIVICLAVLYLLVRLINSKFQRAVPIEKKPELPLGVISSRKVPMDDIPIDPDVEFESRRREALEMKGTAQPFKVETSFEGQRIGAIKK